MDRGRQPWGYVRWKWVQHRSTAPKRRREALASEAALWIRKLRERTDFCREKLAVIAQREGVEASASTIHRYLLRKGLIRPRTNRRRPRYQKSAVMRPNNCPGLGYLQMDVKYVTPELPGLPYTCYLLSSPGIRHTSKVLKPRETVQLSVKRKATVLVVKR